MRLRHGGRSRRLKPAALGRDTSRCAELLFPLAIPNAHGRLEEVMVGRKGAHLQHMLSLPRNNLAPNFYFGMQQEPPYQNLLALSGVKGSRRFCGSI
jgi:hypothetical protein